MTKCCTVIKRACTRRKSGANRSYPGTWYPVCNLQVRHVWTGSRGLVSPFDNPDGETLPFRHIQLRVVRVAHVHIVVPGCFTWHVTGRVSIHRFSADIGAWLRDERGRQGRLNPPYQRLTVFNLSLSMLAKIISKISEIVRNWLFCGLVRSADFLYRKFLWQLLDFPRSYILFFCPF